MSFKLPFTTTLKTDAERQDDRVWSAKQAITRKEEFFGYMLEHMRVKAARPKGLEHKGDNWYAAADGRTIYLNPAWSKDLTDTEIQSVILHEMLHNALLHPFRLGDRDWKLWNVACDIAVNYIMVTHGFGIGDDWISPDVLQQNGLQRITSLDSAEDIYDRLQAAAPQTQQKILEAAGLGDAGDSGDSGDSEGEGEGAPGKGPKKPGKGGGMSGDVLDGPELGEGEDRFDAECEAKDKTQKAVAKGKKAGKLPGSMEKVFTRVFESRVNWRDRVRQFLGGGRQKEQTWSRPNRRLLHDGTYIPGNGAYGPGEVVIVVDTSGSINEALLQTFIDEVDKAHADFSCDQLHVLCVDTRVQWNESFGPHDQVKVNAKGRGGTAFSPAFRWINERGIDAKAVIYFTDLECSDFGPKPEYPVHWIVWPGGRASSPPWGDVVRM